MADTDYGALVDLLLDALLLAVFLWWLLTP